jgi:acetate kinase
LDQADATILALNGGSSSIRFASFSVRDIAQRRLRGRIERIGLSGTTLALTDMIGAAPSSIALPCGDFPSAIRFLLEWLDERKSLASTLAIGHRVVHGMRRCEPARVTPQLLEELRGVIPYDPEHLPAEIHLMEALLRQHPALPQFACFDTAFHQSLPRVARILPIPRRYDAMGVQRYGFHGLSYAWLMRRLVELGDPAARAGRVILAHLGNGASLAAVRDGSCVDTTMGFTPAAGIPMSTRSGDLDPGIVSFLVAREQLTAAGFQRMVTRESGLLGVSGTSSDVRDLLLAEGTDVRAAEALALFCQEVRKRIGAFAAVLGGLDTLVFSAGIGENSAVIRARICAGMEFLGLHLDPARNAGNAPVISAPDSRVTVRVVPTDEEQMIARIVKDYVVVSKE